MCNIIYYIYTYIYLATYIYVHVIYYITIFSNDQDFWFIQVVLVV